MKNRLCFAAKNEEEEFHGFVIGASSQEIKDKAHSLDVELIGQGFFIQ
tara:strand:+ start:795 stop:938 length:144 start_codon:yes stop_codon:yes gene_type:complete